ncbi:MAG: hypothetical protein ACHQ1H_02230 [Nitrososphaerales archaeon]
MPSSAKESKLRTLMVLLQALYHDSLGWSELLSKTGLSKDALSRHLRSLRKRKVLQETVFHKNPGGRGSIKYSLKDSYRKKISGIIEPLEYYAEIEQNAREYSQLSYWHWSRSDRKLSALETHLKAIENAINAITLSELLREPIDDESFDQYVTAQAVTAIRRMLWRSEFVVNLKLNERRVLEEERNKLLARFLSELENMRQNAQLVGTMSQKGAS